MLRPRWLLAVALLVVAAVAVVQITGNGQGASAAGPKPPSKNAGKVEKLHQKAAARTKGDDPDDRPVPLSPEHAAQIAYETVHGKPGPISAAAQPVSGGPGPAPTAPGAVRKIDHKSVAGRAVFAIDVDGTEVDVDRETGTVLATRPSTK
jgi:hypothetical protein